MRVNSVALQHVRRDGKDNYLVDVEPTSNATEGHSSSSLWDTPLVHVHMSKVEEEDNSFSAERCSSSCGDHPPSRLLLMSPQCMIGCSIADRRYPPHNEREELGEYLGIKEANKGMNRNNFVTMGGGIRSMLLVRARYYHISSIITLGVMLGLGLGFVPDIIMNDCSALHLKKKHNS